MQAAKKNGAVFTQQTPAVFDGRQTGLQLADCAQQMVGLLDKLVFSAPVGVGISVDAHRGSHVVRDEVRMLLTDDARDRARHRSIESPLNHRSNDLRVFHVLAEFRDVPNGRALSPRDNVLKVACTRQCTPGGRPRIC